MGLDLCVVLKDDQNNFTEIEYRLNISDIQAEINMFDQHSLPSLFSFLTLNNWNGFNDEEYILRNVNKSLVIDLNNESKVVLENQEYENFKKKIDQYQKLLSSLDENYLVKKIKSLVILVEQLLFNENTELYLYFD